VPNIGNYPGKSEEQEQEEAKTTEMEESIVFRPLFPIATGDQKAPNLITYEGKDEVKACY
jgi:hypothetical protein